MGASADAEFSGFDAGPHYEVSRLLGSGAYGSVYAAVDTRTGKNVALKALLRAHPQALAQFKKEFRALRDVHHVNLVSLRELFEHEGLWIIAMDLIEGKDLLSWVRAPRSAENENARAFDEARLRSVFSGLAQGLVALHEHGLLHRDLKPTNVKVTSEGRAVLLDFGLVSSVDPSGQSTGMTYAGTPEYMPPEQAEGHKLGPPSDWYSFGTCLYEALTGALPFEETSPLALLMKKTRELPVPPSQRVRGIPADLDALCMSLLECAPERRPSGPEICGMLMRHQTPPRVTKSIAPQSLSPDVFEGRERELGQLEQAMARTHEGALCVVLIEGESGIGKSELIREFMARQRAKDARTLCVSGHCYENERVPYKAFDECIDSLSRVLRTLKTEEQAAICTEDVALAAEVFPVLRNVRVKGAFVSKATEDDRPPRRTDAFGALSEILLRLSERHPLIIAIHGLEWTDHESLLLLHALLDYEPRISALFLCTVREGEELDGQTRAALEALRARKEVKSLALSGLSIDAAHRLTRRLLAVGAEESGQTAKEIALESMGHPLLIAELTRFVREVGGHAPPDLTLYAAISRRIDALQVHERLLLEIAALSERPRPESMLVEALGPTADPKAALMHLFAEKLLVRRAGGKVACASFAIKKVSEDRVSPARAAQLHRTIASALERSGGADPSDLAHHWDKAGARPQALDAYKRAADRAAEQLAFARAAQLTARALELVAEQNTDERLKLQIKHAHALAQSGQSADAARSYLAAADLARGDQRLRLRVWAAQHQLQSAQIEQGLKNASAILSELNLPLPQGAASSLARILWERAQLSLTGASVKERSEGDILHADKLALDVMADLITPVTWAEFLPGAALNMHHLRRALSVGEVGHVARALSQEAAFRAARDPDDTASHEPLLKRAEELALKSGSPAVEAHYLLMRATVELFNSGYGEAVNTLARAEEVILERCPGQQWLLTSVRMLLTKCWFHVGDHQRSLRENERNVKDAEARGDLFAAAAFATQGCGFIPKLMSDAPTLALSFVTSAMSAWPPHTFGIAHTGEVMSRGMIAAYQGGPSGFRWLEERRKEHDRAFPHRTRAFRDALHFNRGLAALGACGYGSQAEKAHAMRAVERELRGVSGSRHWGQGAALTLRAQLHVLRNERDRAHADITAARAFYERHAMRTFAESAGYLEGLLEGGESGSQRSCAAVTFFEKQGWVDPARGATLLVPVARLLDAGVHARRGTRDGLIRGRYREGNVIARRRSGVVTQAIDTRTGKAVALKTLAKTSAQDLTRLKHEFRALSGVCHENLARLDALFEHDGTLTIAMELVDGVDFLSYVRPEGKLDTERLRTALSGLLHGVGALHDAGFVHRDIQPRNVLVTPQARVVLIDFGLVTPLSHEQHDEDHADVDVVYVAPEQIDRSDFQTAADVYAIGTCLYVALTGNVPFHHPTTDQVLDAKRRGRPVPPWALGIEVPKDLEELCLSMLEREPARRPSVKAALRALHDGTPAPSFRHGLSGLEQPGKGAREHLRFSGRTHELSALHTWFSEVAKGSCSLLLLEGESGIGKTALLQEALKQLSERDETWLVLRSRCHENEETPYMAFDAAMEELARELRRFANADLDAILPARAALLSQLFPVLSSVARIRDASRKGLPIEPARRRREALAALVQLLVSLSKRSKIVLAIDDLHWADLESMTLLKAVLEQADGARIGIIATRRRGESRERAVESELESLSESERGEVLLVERLSTVEARELIEHAIDKAADPDQLRLLIDEGAGHPLFLRELAASVADGSMLMLGRTPKLEDVLRERCERVSRQAKNLLDLIAVVGRPCPSTVFERALSDPDAFEDAVRELVQQNLVIRRLDQALNCFHDRIRALVTGALSEERQAELCALLAQELEREPEADPGESARLWDRAGVTHKAISAYAEAGAVALDVLAFARADRLFARAIELLPDDNAPIATHLLTQRAHALARSGRSREAAALYSEASQRASGEARIELRIWATEHQIQSAQIEDGMANARALLSELNVPLPRGTAASLTRIVWERALVSSGQLLSSQIKANVPAHERAALDAVQRLIVPVTWVELLPGAALNVGHLKRALALGEAGHIARALSQEGAFRAMQTPDKPERFLPLFERSYELARGTSDVAIEAHVAVMEATANRARSAYVDVATSLERAQELIVSRCPGEQALLTNVRMQLGAAWFNLGAHARCAREGSAWIAEAKERADIFSTAALSGGYGFGLLAPLMNDQPEEALEALDRAMRAWPPQSFGFAHHGELMGRAVIAAYQGGTSGYTWFSAQRSHHDRAFPHRTKAFRDSLLFHRFLATLSAYESISPPERNTLMKELKKDLRTLGERSAIWAKALPAFTQGQIAAVEGEATRARDLLQQAEKAFLQHAMRGAAHSAAYLDGLLEGGEEGRARCQAALQFFTEQGWKDPTRAAMLLVPAARGIKR